MAGLTKKQKSFCIGFINFGNIAEAETYSGVKNGRELLCREEIRDELRRLSDVFNESVACIAGAGLIKLAVGKVSDAVGLLYDERPSAEALNNMDLFMVSEIRRKNDQVEIKFFDRFKALCELSKGNEKRSGSGSFYDALMAGAESLNNTADYGA